MEYAASTATAAYAGPQDFRAIQGAPALYLDFINLFRFLLRIFGARRS
jgi:FtsH-binding integral membrane protein